MRKKEIFRITSLLKAYKNKNRFLPESGFYIQKLANIV